MTILLSIALYLLIGMLIAIYATDFIDEWAYDTSREIPTTFERAKKIMILCTVWLWLPSIIAGIYFSIKEKIKRRN